MRVLGLGLTLRVLICSIRVLQGSYQGSRFRIHLKGFFKDDTRVLYGFYKDSVRAVGISACKNGAQGVCKALYTCMIKL